MTFGLACGRKARGTEDGGIALVCAGRISLGAVVGLQGAFAGLPESRDFGGPASI